MPTQFQEQVYALCKQIPKGKVSTYGAIAKALNKRGHAARAVGQALNKNPYAPSVPCHRVVSSDASIGGFGFGGTVPKIELLEKEGIQVHNGKVVRFKSVLYTF